MLQIRLRKDPHEVSAQWYEKITRRRQGAVIAASRQAQGSMALTRPASVHWNA